jgi:general secretion pathway protein G
MNAKYGFTLVEILIVVTILGILAAMVIPVFGQASTDAKTAALASNLSKMRQQIEVYRNQHNGVLPGTSGSATFEQAMIGKTTLYGDVGGRYGPYIMDLPKNSFTDDSTIRVDTNPAGTGTGWHYNPVTGDFQADDSAEHAAI